MTTISGYYEEYCNSLLGVVIIYVLFCWKDLSVSRHDKNKWLFCGYCNSLLGVVINYVLFWLKNISVSSHDNNK